MVNVLCTDGEGGYVVAGHCGFNGDEMGPQDFFVCRTDSAGFPLWQQVFGGADTNEFAYAAMATANGDVVMAGRDFSYDGLTVVPHLVRLNGEGEIVWNRTYDGATHAQFYGLCELPDGDIIAGGFHYLPGTGADLYLMRVTAAGDTVWTRSYGDSTFEYFTDLALAANGDIVLSGTSSDSNLGNNVRLLRADGNGNVLWSRQYDAGFPAGWVAAETCLAILPDGGIAVGTTTTGINATVA
jgi:hypothetical protein